MGGNPFGRRYQFTVDDQQAVVQPFQERLDNDTVTVFLRLVVGFF